LDPQTLAAAAALSKSGTGIGATINVAVLHASTKAFIGGDADAGGAITVDGESHLLPTKLLLPFINTGPAVTSIAVAGAASQSDPAISGSFIVNDFHVDVDAHIGAGSKINQGGKLPPGGDVTVKAINEIQ